MNREFRLTGVAAVGIALGTAVLLLFAPTMRWQSSLEENCRKGTDS